MSFSGTQYSIGQIQQLLRQAGWPDTVVTEADGGTVPFIVLMSAIAISESQGYAAAHNEAAENSWGLLQVSLQAHPEYTAAQMSDPIQNIKAAYKIYQDRGGGQTGLNAWGPYQTGIYADHIDEAYAAYGGAVTPGGTTTPTGTNTAANPLGPVTQYLPYALGFLIIYLLMDD